MNVVSTPGAAAPAARLQLTEVAAVAVLATLFLAWLNGRDDFIGNIADSAIYLSVAEAYSPWRNGDHALGVALLRDFAFPPLFPLLLSLMGGGSQAPEWSYRAGAVLHGAAITAVYAWLRVEAYTWPRALALTLVFLFAPATLLMALDLQSEPLYIALIFGGFAALGQRAASPGGHTVGALLIGFSALARSAGITAVAAVLVRWLRDGARPWTVGVLAVLPSLCWILVRLALDTDASYVALMSRGTWTDTVAQAWAQVAVNSSAMVHAGVGAFDGAATAQARAVVAGCAILAGLGWILRLRQARVDALYVAFYLALLLAWPYPNHMRRFLAVLLPLFLFYASLGVDTLTTVAGGVWLRRCGAVALVGALMLVVLPASVGILAPIAAAPAGPLAAFARTPRWRDQTLSADAYATYQRTRDIMASMSAIRTKVPLDACVSSSLYSYVPLYGQRRALRLAGASRPAEELEAGLSRCPYIFMAAVEQWPPTDYPPMYPYAKIKDRLEVIEVRLWEQGATRGTVLTMLGRVRPPDDTRLPAGGR